MKKIISIVLVTILIACGSSGSNPRTSPSEAVSTKKILASNVVFKDSSSTTSFLVSSANAEEIDTTIKVYAENVVLDNADTSLSSTDVQAAFAETAPDLSQTIIGTWSISQLNGFDEDGTENDFGREVGTITFNSDNTFSYTTLYSSITDVANPLTVIENQKNSSIENISLDYRISSNMVVLLRLKGIYSAKDYTPEEKWGQPFSQVNPLMVIKSQSGQYLFQDNMNAGILIFTKISN